MAAKSLCVNDALREGSCGTGARSDRHQEWLHSTVRTIESQIESQVHWR